MCEDSGAADERTVFNDSARTSPDLACDVAIIGGGIAGLSVALSLSNTRYAQGGLAAAVGLDDNPDLHLRDTLVAGAGLVHEETARILVYEGPEAVGWLIHMGTQFDERADAAAPSPARGAASGPRHVGSLAKRYALGREAAHSRWRVLHARGDATGAEIERALVAAVRRRTRTTVLENTLALELWAREGACVGVVASRRGELLRIGAARGTVLANGGAGQLWRPTSNPVGRTRLARGGVPGRPGVRTVPSHRAGATGRGRRYLPDI